MWRLPNLPGQPVPVLGHPPGDKVFPDGQRDPCVFPLEPITSGPVTGHHRKEPGSLCFAPFLQVFIGINKKQLETLVRNDWKPKWKDRGSWMLPSHHVQVIQHWCGRVSSILSDINIPALRSLVLS